MCLYGVFTNYTKESSSMHRLQALLEWLAVIENPFGTPRAYIVPAKGDRTLDASRLTADFRPVYSDLTRCVNGELARHVVAAN